MARMPRATIAQMSVWSSWVSMPPRPSAGAPRPTLAAKPSTPSIAPMRSATVALPASTTPRRGIAENVVVSVRCRTSEVTEMAPRMTGNTKPVADAML
jgi:hypothetical protein